MQQLKKDKNAVILAHYYTPKEVQEVADFVGDSFFLAKKARELSEDIVVMAGVYFMGESVKILNPHKKVLTPDLGAGCPMADMVDEKDIQKIKSRYNDIAIACYVNTTAKTKSLCDVCVTSSNAIKVVSGLKQKNILFLPDKNLGRHVQKNLPNKNIILYDGFCPVHEKMDIKNIKKLKQQTPLLAHPECPEELLDIAEYVGSTSGIISEAKKYDEMIVATEEGIFTELEKTYPNKRFLRLEKPPICTDMKKITLEKVINSLEFEKFEIKIDENIRKKAIIPLQRMLEIGN